MGKNPRNGRSCHTDLGHDVAQECRSHTSRSLGSIFFIFSDEPEILFFLM